MTRKINAAGKKLIQEFESCCLEAYPDPGGPPPPLGSGEPWTIGWGETEGVVRGMVWSQAYADHRFEMSLAMRERTVERLVKVPLTDNEFSSLVAFVYNVGEQNFRNSTLLRKLNAGTPRDEVAEEFGKWVRAKGKIMRGLIRRRAAERDLFLRPLRV